jgi:hypothetical protein
MAINDGLRPGDPPEKFDDDWALTIPAAMPTQIPVIIVRGRERNHPREATRPATSAMVTCVAEKYGVTGFTIIPPIRNERTPVTAPQRIPMKIVTRIVPTASRKEQGESQGMDNSANAEV